MLYHNPAMRYKHAGQDKIIIKPEVRRHRAK